MFYYYIYITVLSPKFSNLRTNFNFLEMRDVMSLQREKQQSTVRQTENQQLIKVSADSTDTK